MMNSNPLDDRVTLVSQCYPDPSSHLGPQPTRETKPRTRRGRRKSRGGQSGISGTKKRKLSQEQVILLERNFGDERKLESQRKNRLAAELDLDPRQVAVWFQNRRARYKSKKLEEEYSRLRAAHENAVVEKYRLEAEFLKLKDSLAEAEKEIQQLSERLDNRGSSNSPISSTDVVEQSQFPGDYAYDDFVFMPETGYINGISEWVNLYL